MYILFIVIFSIWFLISIIYIVQPRLLGKLRMPLHRYGFLANWSMYVPNQDKVRKTYNLMYRDRDKNGNIQEWVEFKYPNWYPFIFIFNLQGRLLSVVSKCTSTLIRMSQQGNKKLDEDPRFLYLCEIVCSFHPKPIGSSRQIKLEFSTLERPDLLISQSGFILLK